MKALLDAIDRSTATGERDFALAQLMGALVQRRSNDETDAANGPLS